MTEADWLNEMRRPQWMIWNLRGTTLTRTKAGKRKLRLFTCGCCRLTWELLTESLLRQSVEVAERFADARIGKDELARAYASARELEMGMGMLSRDAQGVRERTAANMAVQAAQPQAFSSAFAMTAYPVPLAGCYAVGEEERDAVLCRLLRCVFANPFHPVTVDPAWRAWRDGTLRKMAEVIYAERAFDHLPILADGLEEAGCTDASILDHLRGAGPHVRGCWVVDLLLDNS